MRRSAISFRTRNLFGGHWNLWFSRTSGSGVKKLLTLRVDTKVGWRSRALADDEKHLSRRELGDKHYQEAKSQGRNIERLPDKAMF